MEYVENKEFYHIQRKVFYNNAPFWDKGQTIIAGKDKNPYTQVLEKYEANSGKEKESMAGAIRYYQNIIREMVFEEVRKEHFPTLPSRKKCLWVIPNEIKRINYWWDRLPRDDNEERVLLKLRLTGNIHKCNQSFITLDYASVLDKKELALNYWSGVPGNSDIENEYLFEGTVTVEEIFDSPNDLIF